MKDSTFVMTVIDKILTWYESELDETWLGDAL